LLPISVSCCLSKEGSTASIVSHTGWAPPTPYLKHGNASLNSSTTLL
jgi:hypothetical protein